MSRSKPKTASDIDHARRVLALESEALKQLGESLDDSFGAAVELLLKIEGRVVVSGMGKSGHVARKVAATFASTGTPAQFVHPAEASHGDMGAITSRDAVMVMSNSGETREISDLLAHARRYAIPLVGVASVRKSTLIESADVGLVLPEVPEACPMGLAPTTSTTMMLALGDALAVALMERRGFTRDEYRVLHPGGQLGKALIRVADLMHKGDELPLVRPGAAMREVLLEITSKSFGCAGVIDDEGRLIGIITDGDLRRHMSEDLLEKTAGAVMTGHPRTVRAGALAAEAVGIMNNARSRPILCLFVTADGTAAGRAPQVPVGIIHVHDCLRAGVA
jgi:arabinose-5-phosphate isomerase